MRGPGRANPRPRPHIVEVHDRGEHDGQLWVTMDYVDGTDAARWLREHYPHGMPVKDAVEMVSAIADALDYAHERNLLHRDVKPANVLIANPGSAEQRILLADFGIARDISQADRLTATNMTLGTVDYAAPEQLTGGTLDGRADQYALACAAFHLLTGRPPFANSSPAATINGHLASPPPRIGALRAELQSADEVFAKAMAKTPADRFDTCRDFAVALARCDSGGIGANDATKPAYETIPPPDPGTYRPEPVSTTGGSPSLGEPHWPPPVLPPLCWWSD